MAYHYSDYQDFHHFYRPRHRSHGPVAYHEHTPYRHQQTRYDHRPDQYEDAANQTFIGQTESQGSNETQRRRIAIAVCLPVISSGLQSADCGSALDAVDARSSAAEILAMTLVALLASLRDRTYCKSALSIG